MPVEIPRSLGGWDENRVNSLVEADTPETDRHDYKARLPDSRTLNKICCAFANTRGGFILLGIRQDGGTVSPEGVERNPELGKWIHDRLAVSPSLSIATPKPISARSADGLIYVVHIPESNQKPHLPTRDGERVFWRRVEAACEQMDREMVRMQFQQTDQRIQRLRLALREIYEYLKEVKTYTRSPHGWGFIQKPPKTAVDRLFEEIAFLSDEDEYSYLASRVGDMRRQVRRIDSEIQAYLALGGNQQDDTDIESYHRRVRDAGSSLASEFNNLLNRLSSQEAWVPDNISSISF